MVKAINELTRHQQLLASEVDVALKRVLSSGWYINGLEVGAFETEFAAYCGVGFCVGVGNGTDALEIALRALHVGGGDTVATVANAGGYSTSAIYAAGAKPLYVDIDSDYLTMSPIALEGVIDASTKAIIATHLYGRLADMDAILGVADECGIPVIEDCAQSHGAMRNGKRAGSWGNVACFSFYPTKNLGAFGDGGAVATSDASLATRIRQIHQYGWESKYKVTLMGGRNSRLDEIQAAILRVQLPHLDEWNRRRRNIARLYRELISHPDVVQPDRLDESYVAHLYVVRAARRDYLQAHLSACGIPTDVHYPVPDYRQPAVAAGGHAPLATTEKSCAEVLTLPCFPEMTDAEVADVAEAVNAWTV